MSASSSFDMDDNNNAHDNDSAHSGSAMSCSDASAAEEEPTTTMTTPAQHKEHGNAAYQRRDYRAAIEHYTRAIELAQAQLLEVAEVDGDAEQQKQLLGTYYGNRAAAFTMILAHVEALRDCDSATGIDPQATKVHFRKAKLLTSLGRLDDALQAYSYGLIHDPNHASAIQERAAVTTLQKRFALARTVLQTTDHQPKKHARQALAQIEIVLTACPSWGDATLTKIDALTRLHQVDQALTLSTQLMARPGYESNNELILLRAKCLFLQGSIDPALKHLRIILGSDPDHKPAFTMLKMVRHLKKTKDVADTAYKSHKHGDAVTLYGAAIDACPAENASYKAKLFFNRAASHNALRQHAECVADCSMAIALDGGYTKAYLRRAASSLLIGGKADCEQAIGDYEHVLGLAQSDEEVRDLRKKIREAKIQLKRAGRKDLYKIMGVGRDATEAEIKKAYRKMALKHHVCCSIVPVVWLCVCVRRATLDFW
jgi:DnaJ family protein C protein 7